MGQGFLMLVGHEQIPGIRSDGKRILLKPEIIFIHKYTHKPIDGTETFVIITSFQLILNLWPFRPDR